MSSKFTRRQFIAATAGATALTTVRTKGVTSSASQRPNILFILADDLGYGDLSCYGRPDYRTPVLDRLATQGTKFLSAYAAAPVCSPTRCAFVTGRYPQRVEVGLYEPLTGRDLDKGLPPDHPTVASLLKANGYDTALIGKWHLGWKPEFGPNRHGYDEFFGILSGAGDYFTHRSSDAGGADLWENLAPVEHIGYLTDLLSDRASQYVARRRKKPFYLSLHYTAPHAPWEGPEDAGIDHSSHGADSHQSNVVLAHKLGNSCFIHRLGVAVDQQDLVTRWSERLQEEHPKVRHEVASDPVVGVVEKDFHDSPFVLRATTCYAFHARGPCRATPELASCP